MLHKSPQIKNGAASAGGNGQQSGMRQWLRYGDFLVVILTFALAATLLWMAPRLLSSQSATAVLIQDGQVIRQWSEQELLAGGEAAIESHGFHYKIAWQDGRISFAEADCPDKVCVRSGWLSRPGSIAACIPGNLILKASIDQAPGSTETDEVDVVIK